MAYQSDAVNGGPSQAPKMSQSFKVNERSDQEIWPIKVMPSTADHPSMITLRSNGHNFYLTTSKEEILTSLES
jgi:hypothetical protein